MNCKSCGAPIEWAAHHKTGKRMPMQLDAQGTWIVIGSLAYLAVDRLIDADDRDRPRYSSHFAKCPQASKWRARK